MIVALLKNIFMSAAVGTAALTVTAKVADHYINKTEEVFLDTTQVIEKKYNYIDTFINHQKDTFILHYKDSTLFHVKAIEDTLEDSIYSQGAPFVDSNSHVLKINISGTNPRVKTNKDVIIRPQSKIAAKPITEVSK